MKTKKFLTVAIFALLLNLVGCSYIGLSDRSCEYQGSTCLPPLMLPPSVCHSAQVGDDLTIPHLQRARTKTSLLPPDSLALQVDQGKLSKKELKKRELESRLTQVTWTKNKWGAPALTTSESLPSTFEHLQRAFKTPSLSKLFLIKNTDEALATFYIYDLAVTQGKISAATPLYELRLVELENGTMIILAADESQPTPTTQVTQRILTKIREGLDDTKEGLSLKQWLFS